MSTSKTFILHKQHRSARRKRQAVDAQKHPRGCTFSPKLYAARRPASAPRGQKWHDRLHNNSAYSSPKKHRPQTSSRRRYNKRNTSKNSGRVPRVASIKWRHSPSRLNVRYDQVYVRESRQPELLVSASHTARKSLPRYFFKQF